MSFRSRLQRLRSLPFPIRVTAVAGLAVLCLAVALALPPIAQSPGYHGFADQRVWLGIPHPGDLLSNAAFLLVGTLGVIYLLGRGSESAFPRRPGGRPEKSPYLVYFLAVALVAAGSAYYHARPTTETLFWDRLPMGVAFMAFFSAVIMERIHVKAGLILLPVLVALGAWSVIAWHLGEAAGRGDLRFYALVQFFPMLAIPLICLLFPSQGRGGRYLVALFGLYGLAKLFEVLDHQIFAWLGATLSGHGLKHLAAAAAAYMVLPMIRRRNPGADSGPPAC